MELNNNKNSYRPLSKLSLPINYNVNPGSLEANHLFEKSSMESKIQIYSKPKPMKQTRKENLATSSLVQTYNPLLYKQNITRKGRHSSMVNPILYEVNQSRGVNGNSGNIDQSSDTINGNLNTIKPNQVKQEIQKNQDKISIITPKASAKSSKSVVDHAKSRSKSKSKSNIKYSPKLKHKSFDCDVSSKTIKISHSKSIDLSFDLSNNINKSKELSTNANFSPRVSNFFKDQEKLIYKNKSTESINLHSKNNSSNQSFSAKVSQLASSQQRNPCINLNIKDKSARLLFILASSKIIDSKTRFKFLKMNKNLYNNINFKSEAKKIVVEKLQTLKKRQEENNIIILEYKEEINSLEKKYQTYYSPTLTSQQGLNMVKLDEIQALAKKNNDEEEVLVIYQYILLLLNEEDDSKSDDENKISFFINTVFPKFKVRSIKDLFLEVIAKRRLSNHQCSIIDSFDKENSKFLNQSAVLRLHKATSYMIYFIKDYVDYAKKKLSNGVYAVTVLNAIEDNKRLVPRIDTLTSFLNVKV